MASESAPSRVPSASPNHATPHLHIIVRFTTSIPDLNLEINSPSRTTVIFLKHEIRSNVSAPVASSRLRLIYGGKILNDTSTLSSALKLPPPPPKSILPSNSKGKGKETVVEPARVYINCSIGDELSEKELAAEKHAALASPISSKPSKEIETEPKSEGRHGSQTTTPAPRGFDRLLSTGFSAAEVGQLRLQFMAIQSRQYTPDDMPSQAELRRMEDAWLDNNGVNGDTGAGGFGNDIAEGSMDILIWGSIIGFMWPLGAVGWAIREEGIWSKQMQMAVFTGFVLSLAFGVLRLVS